MANQKKIWTLGTKIYFLSSKFKHYVLELSENGNLSEAHFTSFMLLNCSVHSATCLEHLRNLLVHNSYQPLGF